MSSPYFRFKQFTVWHDRCAMKVGTDGVLLGAWAFQNARYDIPGAHILDIGTGTGLIALMLAQRWKTDKEACDNGFHILGIDIDEQAVLQAQDNFTASPWSEHLSCKQISLQELHGLSFDYIISNPPYFVNSLRNPDLSRQTARHTDTLSYEDLLDGIARLLSDEGSAALILPAESEEEILSLAAHHSLYPGRLVHVCSKPNHAPKRILLELTRCNTPSRSSDEPDTFYIESAHSPRSEEYAALTKDFYL